MVHRKHEDEGIGYMRRRIGSKLYDTDTSEFIDSFTSNSDGSSAYAEMLYRKRSGSYFLHVLGAASSPYGRRRQRGGYPLEDIYPMGYDDALSWYRDRIDAHAGELPSMGPDRAPVSDAESIVYLGVHVSAAAKQSLMQASARSGRTQNAIVDELLRDLVSDSYR